MTNPNIFLISGHSPEGYQFYNVQAGLCQPLAHSLFSCMQDVAIANGYNNVPRRQPPTATTGSEQPLNQLTDLLRLECAMAGFTEILTWALCSRAENWGHLLLQEQPAGAVGIGNPATVEFEICRTSLLAGASDAREG